MSASLRLGCVKYLNARPLIYGWPGSVEFDHPSALCRKLAAGELDLALVSSFEYLRNPIYAIVDDVAVTCDGPVYSVFVAHRGEIADLAEITLDPASATSVNLLRCILGERNLRPHFSSLAAESGRLGEREGRLLIGDHAIRFRREHSCEFAFFDLGAEWKRLTGLPFVFACWLIRPELPDIAKIAHQLRAVRDANLSQLDAVIADATDFSREFCASYFGHYLRFTFAEREKEGLLRFRSLCQKHGILPPNASQLRLA